MKFVIAIKGSISSLEAGKAVSLAVEEIFDGATTSVVSLADGVEGSETLSEFKIDAFFSIINSACSLEWAMEKEFAFENLKNTATQVF